ncbi:MAG: nitrite reductase large subunit [Candidatus Saccharibacteria bacterium]|jgi:nitrite reductase (NADH) large subunit|nr:nitrite reductase large subunit [Candidatus Saccharibacteria bacterium]
MRKTILVVGHGMVGHRLLELLAERGATKDWRIVVLAAENRPAYNRVQLSSYFTGNTAEDLTLAPDSFFAEHGIELHLGQAAVALDREAQTVTTASGQVFAFDVLVLATGSYAFVPPIPGNDAEGCFVYRTIDDLQAISNYAAGSRVGAVLGGGLLGLEAANALLNLGLSTHVVEHNPHLMARQIDGGGGDILRRLIEGLDVSVHTGKRTTHVETDESGRVVRMVFGDGSTLDVDMVVFSAGIRANDQLARAGGLEVGERGGIVVDESCLTSDPNIYAIGECALAWGQTYGLVAPGYNMAEVAADRILGGMPSFTPPDMSTKLKLLNVAVASFGDPFAVGAQKVVYSDSTTGVYKMLALSPDGVLLGGVLIGDASAYTLLHALVGQPLPGPEQYLLPESEGGAAAAGPDALPDSATICTCNNVTKGAICKAIGDGAHDVPAIKKCTKAGTGCGSCIKTLSNLLPTELGKIGIAAQPPWLKSVCEHFDYSRKALLDIIMVEEISSFEELIAKHGRGQGCAECKPVVASILASLDSSRHILEGTRAGQQATNERRLANKQKGGTYSVVPDIPGGVVTDVQLMAIAETARDFKLELKITSGQRIDLLGARLEQLPAIWRRMRDVGLKSGQAYGKSMRTVTTCLGTDWCRYGVQDSTSMGIRLVDRYRGLRSPHKVKAGVSGCNRNCGVAHDKDFGVVATKEGWNLYVGGNGGDTPRLGVLFASDLKDEELVRTIDRFLMFYIRLADKLERTAPWIERLDGGLDYLRAVIMEDRMGICDELDRQMAAHVEGYVDEWELALNTPEILEQFVAFVNDQDAVDPDIQFETVEGRRRPVLLSPDLKVVSSIGSEWTGVCPFDQLVVGRGVPVIVEGVQLALFLDAEGRLYAVSNHDPFSRNNDMAGGITGTRDGVPTVTAPMYGQVFSLETGVWLDDDNPENPAKKLATYAIRVSDGVVQVAEPSTEMAHV